MTRWLQLSGLILVLIAGARGTQAADDVTLLRAREGAAATLIDH